MSVHPITFSIPEEKIVSCIPEKVRFVSALIPGDMKTYIYNTEKEYYDQYKESMFAITTKKAGWDCMRHYEILANGCIPYFPGIEECPSNTMALLPKDLLQQAITLCNNFSSDDSEKYTVLAGRLLDYTREHLTTRKMAQYILDTTNHSTAKKILFLSGRTDPDYLRCVTLHGFKTLLGKDCHDYPKVPHVYKDQNINYSRLYGKGITYTNLISPELHSEESDQSLVSDIEKKVYDLIIYGSYHRGIPFYHVVMKHYKASDVVLLCGEDIHSCDYTNWTKNGHYVFVRELDT